MAKKKVLRYTSDQESFLRQHVPVLEFSEKDRGRAQKITDELNHRFGENRSVEAVILKHRNLNGLNLKNGKATTKQVGRHRYTPEQDTFLLNLFSKKDKKQTWKKITKAFNGQFGTKVKQERLESHLRHLKDRGVKTPTPVPMTNGRAAAGNTLFEVSVENQVVWSGSSDPSNTISVTKRSVIATL